MSPTRADLRTLDGTARALGLQADSFQALATILDTIRDLMAELVRDPEVVAPAFGAEPSLVVEVAARSALAAHLTAIGFAHLRSRNELLRGIASRTEPAVQTDPAKCALGCWLDAYEAHGGEESAILAKLRPLHERLHQCAVGIIDDTRRGAAVHDLLDVVQREVTPCFAETWACLIQLIGGVQASAAAAVSLLRPAS
ncbi:MAG: CZB domain-containing protein [Deltaproteobacteria bacterium]|nr:CZB domain-containing protein [Deltaproteobacteria bacterium]